METSDPVVVSRAREGDVDAFGELFRATHRRIYNFVRSMVTNPEDAADLTQKTYVRAWGALKSLRSDEAFLVWLHRIALNVVRDSRKRIERPTESLDAPVDGEESPAALEIPDWSLGPGQMVLSADTQRFVRRAVGRLPEIHRTVVAMHHLEGMEVTAIAEVLGISAGTVLSRLARAREALRRTLDSLVKE
ncbi:MAG: sigma-70 family RNA polymerase sigma factor [Verrucomicrobia bacterium]|nr:sigma-70 family RNA polymerase sigma factor [Verrucomicrobiota bacterium]